jgi:Kdo2-lipid IVA lauroyltransferase/acyltransferase
MNAVAFYLFYGLVWTITLLPLSILYLISDLLYLILYYIVGYRIKVVRTNLKNAFPEKTGSERKSIEKRFYRHLSDMFVETVKLIHLSEKELRKRLVITNPELLSRLFSEGRDVIAVLGHYSNWEFLTILPKLSDYTIISVYRPLKNKYFDKLIINLRTRYGHVLSPMSSVIRDLIRYKKDNRRTFTALLSDQTPAKADIHHWTKFLNQDTAVYLGAEKIATKYGMAVVFMNFKKVRRGYYAITFELICDNGADMPEYAITEAHVKRLEEIIREKPEYWIWSHRRWKHKREPSDG